MKKQKRFNLKYNFTMEIPKKFEMIQVNGPQIQTL